MNGGLLSFTPASSSFMKRTRGMTENLFTRTTEQCEPNIVRLNIQIDLGRPQLQTGTDGPDNETGGRHGKRYRKVKNTTARGFPKKVSILMYE